jgi:3-oxoacyl-[acyl-carrier-protein] synthase III
MTSGSTRRSVVRGIGSYLPERILTNEELAQMVETSDAWITERTGISRRHIASDDETTGSLGLKAAERALEHTGLTGSDLDLIICATATPDFTFPSTAVQIQAALGNTKGAAFDLQAVCSGFVYALATADQFIKSGMYSRVMVIGTETFSRILDWSDRNTCVLFGDGAAALVLEAQDGDGTLDDRGVLFSHLRSDGRYRQKLYVDGGASTSKHVGHLRMEGREVFRHAVINLAETIAQTFAQTGLTSADIDWFVPHQANRRIIEATAHKLNLSMDKVVMTVQDHGNTSAASIPLALAVGVADGRIKAGQLVLVEAMGGGFTWGSALIRW